MLRYKLYLLFFLIIGIFSFNLVSANENNLPLLGHVIYIDPGHGGYSYTKINMLEMK